MNQDGYYYIWSGVGAIEEIEDAEPLYETPAKALAVLKSKSEGHWTLWLREGYRAILVAIWIPSRQRLTVFDIDCAELQREGPEAFFLPGLEKPK